MSIKKLTKEQEIELIKDYTNLKVKIYSTLSMKYKIKNSTISRILNRNKIPKAKG